jgi:hypothetical protein
MDMAEADRLRGRDPDIVLFGQSFVQSEAF